MRTLALTFVEDRRTKNSVAALVGALEVSPVLDRVWVDFAPREALAAHLAAPAPEGRRRVLAWSLATAAVPGVAGTVRAIRDAAGPPPLLLAGGPHPSGDPAGTLALGFDLVLVGEGEESLPALLGRLLDDGLPDRLGVSDPPGLGDLPGLVWRERGTIRRNAAAPPVVLDRYPAFARRHWRFAPIEISRGCPHACRFCQAAHLLGGRMRHRSLDQVVRHIELARDCGLRHLRFNSPSAFCYGSPDGRTPDLAAVEALLRAAREVFGQAQVFFGTFPSEARPETVSREALDLVRGLTGTDRIVIGAQTGSDRLLARLNRGHDVADVVHAVERIRAAGLAAVVDVIFGLPGETPADQAATRALITRLIALGATIHGHTFMPLPGTPLAGAPPGRIDPALRRWLERLTSHGHLFGHWRAQAQPAAAP